MRQQRRDRVIKVIETLSDGQFHSGESLGQLLGVSRTAVSQYIGDVQALGVDVFRITGKGYRLADAMSLLDLSKIQSYLNLGTADSENIKLERVLGSTNDFVKAQLHHGIDSGFCVIAEAQTEGRGRRGKRWVSPFGANLYMSMYWRLEQGMTAAMGLSIALGTVVAELLSEFDIYDVEVKWPNDILVNGKKIAGILIELDGQALGEAHAIVGIGINLAMPSWLENQIDQPWTDFRSASPVPLDRDLIAAKLIGRCREALTQYESKGLTSFLGEWKKYDRLAMKPVRILMGEKEIHGIAEGIDETGALLVKREGKLERFHAGEVSLRYGL